MFNPKLLDNIERLWEEQQADRMANLTKASLKLESVRKYREYVLTWCLDIVVECRRLKARNEELEEVLRSGNNPRSIADMDCPVLCTRCGLCIELVDSNFITPHCNCTGSDCSHGICDTCLEELE